MSLYCEKIRGLWSKDFNSASWTLCWKAIWKYGWMDGWNKLRNVARGQVKSLWQVPQNTRKADPPPHLGQWKQCSACCHLCPKWLWFTQWVAAPIALPFPPPQKKESGNSTVSIFQLKIGLHACGCVKKCRPTQMIHEYFSGPHFVTRDYERKWGSKLLATKCTCSADSLYRVSENFKL